MLNEQEIIDFITTEISGYDYNQKFEILQTFRKSICEVEKKIKSHTKYCPNCKSYTDINDWKITTEKVTQVETTYTDCGYGDDDLIADVTSIVSYDVCPKCEYKKQRDKTTIKIENERRRRN